MSQSQPPPKTPPSTSSRSQNTSKSHLPHHHHQSSNPEGQESNADPSTLYDHHHHFPTTTNPYVDSTSFSPSKARTQARQTQQLNEVKRWLTSLLLPTTSSVDLNDRTNVTTAMQTLISKWESEYLNLTTTNAELARDVMGALRGVMSLNQIADERRRLLAEARREEVEVRKLLLADDGGGGREDRETRVSTHRVEELSEGVVEHLTDLAVESLDSIAKIAVSLGVIPRVDGVGGSLSLVGEIGTALLQRTVEMQVLQNHVMTLERVSRELSRKIEQAQEQLLAVKGVEADRLAKTEVMQAQTAQWVRETKQILLKLQEYNQRISILDNKRPDGMVRIEDVVRKQEQVRKRREVIEKLEADLRSFHNLPPDLEASRAEVRRARMELNQWKSKREDFFGQMASM